MDTYTIRLNTIHISKTRSRHADTNYLTFAVQSGASAPVAINAKLGDMTDGDYSVSDLIARTPQPAVSTFPSNATDSITITNPQDPVIISWAVTNRGHLNDQDALSEISQIG